MDDPGQLFLIWQLCRPVEADPPGLGMRWEDAIRLNPTIARFLLSGKEEARAVSLKYRARYMKAGGLKVQDAKAAAKEYMRALREKYTGKGDVDG